MADHYRKSFLTDLIGLNVHRGGEEPKRGETGVGLKLLQQIMAVGNIQKVQNRLLGQPQGNVQIAKTNVAVDAKDSLSFLGEGGGNAGADGSFTGSAFSGQKCDGFAHVQPPLWKICFHYKGITYKNQEDFMKNSPGIIHLLQKVRDASAVSGLNAPIHKLFTEKSVFPLAFLERLGYHILALKEKEC